MQQDNGQKSHHSIEIVTLKHTLLPLTSNNSIMSKNDENYAEKGNENKKKEKAKEYSVDFAENTSMHGCGQLFSDNIAKRIVWILVILGFSGAAGFYLYERIMSYLEFEVSVSIRKKFDSNKALTFPAISVCNYNRFFYNDLKLNVDMTRLVDNFELDFNVASYAGQGLTGIFAAAGNNVTWITDLKATNIFTDHWNANADNSSDPVAKANFDALIDDHLYVLHDYMKADADTAKIWDQIEMARVLADVQNPSKKMMKVSKDGKPMNIDDSKNLAITDNPFVDPFTDNVEMDAIESVLSDFMVNFTTGIDWSTGLKNAEAQNAIYDYDDSAYEPPAGYSYDSSYTGGDYGGDYFADSSMDGGIDFANYDYEVVNVASIDSNFDYSVFSDPARKQSVKSEFGSQTLLDMYKIYGWKLNEITVPFVVVNGVRQKFSQAFQRQITSEGVCFTLKESFIQRTAGDGNGITFGVNIQQDHYTELDYREGMSQNVDPAFLPDQAGARLYVYDRNEPLPTKDRAIQIAPGTKSHIALNKYSYEYMYKPWGQCDEVTKIMDGGKYSSQTCMIECYIKKMIAACGCKPAYTKGIKKFVEDANYQAIRECQLDDFLEQKCFNNLADVKKDINMEYCQCPESCKEVIYDAKITTTPWPSARVANNLTNFYNGKEFLKYLEDSNYYTEVSESNIKNNVAVVDVFFEDLRVIETVESQKDPVISFICDIGGTLGLWLGMSLMTMVEIVLFVVCFVPSLVQKSKVGNNANPVEKI